ncbi:MAG: TonB-dependent receptor plug domain-containing protein [Maribacter sp.]|nr:TonB-dependent receptor plug domain-containing protein [Maribacter sp.]
MKTFKRFALVISFLLCATISMHAQKKVVKGKITTFNTIRVQQAEITAKKTKNKVFSDSLGFFTIECEPNDKLTVRAIGFKTKSVKMKKMNESLTINLAIAGSESDIALAIDKGHLSKNNRAQAIKYFNFENSYGFGYTNIIDLIKGKFPQISVIGDEFILRGSNSITPGGKNGALIVLNGALSDISSLKSIVVSEVEDISILSGSAASRYGSGGGNGVISIKLKSH